MELLDNIAWAFTDTDYPTQEIFSQAVMQYQLEIMEDRNQWHPGEVVIHGPEVEIIYEYWSDGTQPKFDDETLLDEYAEDDEEEEEDDITDIFDDADEMEEERQGQNTEDMDQVEVKVRFTADNGINFTAAELLYKLHQRLRHRELGDHIFFEGLHAFGENANAQPPVFYLYCGS